MLTLLFLWKSYELNSAPANIYNTTAIINTFLVPSLRDAQITDQKLMLFSFYQRKNSSTHDFVKGWKWLLKVKQEITAKVGKFAIWPLHIFMGLALTLQLWEE